MQVGFFGILGVVFIVLKLMEIISWSWSWVLLPLYGGLLVTLFFMALLYFVTK